MRPRRQWWTELSWSWSHADCSPWSSMSSVSDLGPDTAHAGAATAKPHAGSDEPQIAVRNLTMAYGDFVVLRGLNFVVERGEIFVIMGGSGCGKSTLLRHLVGLENPAAGEIFYGRENFTRAA